MNREASGSIRASARAARPAALARALLGRQWKAGAGGARRWPRAHKLNLTAAPARL